MATKSKLTIWRKFGRFITGVVVAVFFLPFFGVSCGGMDVITVSGTDMVGGCRPGGMLSEASDRAGRADPESAKGEVQVSKVNIEPLAIIAFACAIVGFGLAWVRSRGALVGALVVSLAGIGALIGLYVKVGGEMKDGIAKQMAAKAKAEGVSSGGPGRDVDVDSGGRMGLWLAFIGFASVAGLAGMALREPERELPKALARPPRYPPGGPPGPPGPPGDAA